MAEFRMPILGADMTAGTLIEWRKQPGDVLHRGDIIAEVETDKADVEVEVFTEGVLEQVLVAPGTEVPVGTPLAIIGETGAPVAAAPAVAPTPAAPPPPHVGVTTPTPALVSVRATALAGRVGAVPVRATPAARLLAEKLGVDLASVEGTGPGGRVQERDVETAAAVKAQPARAAVPAPAAQAADRQARMREAIAAAMTRSNREIPQFHLANPIDMTRALAWLATANLSRPVSQRLLYGVLLIKAVALALRDVPELNAVWQGGQSVPQAAAHVGAAISLRGGGLVAPALHDVSSKSLDALMAEFLDLVQRARAGRLRSSELADPTITITSLGEQGVESVYGLVYPPQVALVGFGKIVRRPWAVEEEVVSHPIIVSTLAADHRVVDGHRGSVYLAAIDRLLQEPEKL